jgi:hypothetical protein
MTATEEVSGATPEGTKTMSDINELRSALLNEWTELAPAIRMSKASARAIAAMEARIFRLARERNAFDAGDLSMLADDIRQDGVIAMSALKSDTDRELATRLDALLAHVRAVRDQLLQSAVDGSGASRAVRRGGRISAGFPWR